jgi:hypothetical protein
VQGFDDRDVKTTCAGRRRDLRADEAGSDDDGPGAVVERAADRVCVVHPAQDVHTSQMAGARQFPRRRTGRDHQCVVMDVRPARAHDTGAEVEPRRRGVQQHLHAVVVGEFLTTAEGNGPGRAVRREELLGQRRPVVGQVGFGADQGDPAVKTGLARALDGP